MGRCFHVVCFIHHEHALLISFFIGVSAICSYGLSQLGKWSDHYLHMVGVGVVLVGSE
jgi:hypothetical protein